VRFFQPWPGYGIQAGSWQADDFNGDGLTDLFHITGLDFVIHPWISSGIQLTN
jgi:hypothetical protein